MGMVIALGMTLIAWWRWSEAVGSHDAGAGDSVEYRAGRAAPRPFCWRWGLTVVARWGAEAWMALTAGWLTVSGPIIWLWLRQRGCSELGAFVGVWLWICLPSVWERSARIVHLPEGVVIPLCLLSAEMLNLPEVGWWVGIALALIAGTLRETSGVWIALYAGSPWGLVGLLTVPWWRRGGAPTRNHHLFDHPWRLFGRERLRRGFAVRPYLTCWGAAAPGLLTLNPWVWGAVAFAAWPLLRSVDTARLLAYAWPLVMASAVGGADERLLLALAVLAPLGAFFWDA